MSIRGDKGHAQTGELQFYFSEGGPGNDQGTHAKLLVKFFFFLLLAVATPVSTLAFFPQPHVQHIQKTQTSPLYASIAARANWSHEYIRQAESKACTRAISRGIKYETKK